MKCLPGKIWYEIVCPDSECGAVNFIYGGYFPDSDSSKMDADGFICWKCGEEFGFFTDTDEELFYIQDGQKCPGNKS